MSDNKKLNPLDRVRAKAEYNYMRRLREAEEDRRFKQSLDGGFVEATEDVEEVDDSNAKHKLGFKKGK